MKIIYFVFLVLILVVGTGCKQFKRIVDGPESRPAQIVTFPDHYEEEGITLFDFQSLSNIPTVNRDITVYVKVPDSNIYDKLNKYEYSVSDPTSPVSGGSVIFGKEVHIFGSRLIITGNPAAPQGTEYRLISEKVN